MKALFIKYPQNVSQYRNTVNGWKFIETIDSEADAYRIVANREDQDFLPQDDGTVTTASGPECYDPAHPDRFEFGDFTYYVVELSDLVEGDDEVRAIEREKPWNLDDIMIEVNNWNEG